MGDNTERHAVPGCDCSDCRAWATTAQYGDVPAPHGAQMLNRQRRADYYDSLKAQILTSIDLSYLEYAPSATVRPGA